MKNRKKIKKIVLAVSATSGSLPLVFLPISQTNTTGSSQEIDSKYMSYTQYNKVQDDGIYTNYTNAQGMFYNGWSAFSSHKPIYIGATPGVNNQSGKTNNYINYRNNWYRLYDYNDNLSKQKQYGNNYNRAWDLLNPSLVLSNSLIEQRYNWQKNSSRQDSSFFNGDGWDAENDTKTFKVGFNVDNLKTQDKKYLAGIWFSEDLILTGEINVTLSTRRNSDGSFNLTNTNSKNVRTYKLRVDENYNVADKFSEAQYYQGVEDNKYKINPWISKSYDYTGYYKSGSNFSGLRFYNSNKNFESVEFDRNSSATYKGTGKSWLNSMHYGSFYNSNTYPREISANINQQYDVLWGTTNDYFKKRTLANMVIHDEPALDGDYKYVPYPYKNDAYKLGLHQKQYADKFIYDSLNNNQGGLLIFEIRSEDETEHFTPSLQVEFTLKRNPATIDNNGVRIGNSTNSQTRSSSNKKTYIGFGQFKYEWSKWADRQYGSFMKIADRQTYQNIKLNTSETIIKSEYLLDSDKLPNTSLSLIEETNGVERFIHSIDKSKYNEIINENKILSEYKTKNNIDSLILYRNMNNLKLKTSFINSEDSKKWKIISNNSYSTTNSNLFSFNDLDENGYINFNNISYDLTDYEKLRRFANDRTKNKWLTAPQINHLLDQIKSNSNFNESTYSFNGSKWFDYYKNEIANLNTLQGQAEEKRAELRRLVLSTTDKTDWNNEISNKVLFAFADQREAKGPALKLLELEGFNRQTQRKYNLQSNLNSNNEAINRDDETNVLLQNATEVQQFINDVDATISKIKSSGKTNLENEFINTLNSQSITNVTWSNYNYVQGTKFIIDAINSVLSRYNTPYDITTFVPTNNAQYQSNKNTILNKIKSLSNLYDEIQKIKPIIDNIQNDKLVYGKTNNKSTTDNAWYTNFVTKLQNSNNALNDSSYAFYSQGNLDTFKTQNASNLKTNWIDKILELNGNKSQFTNDINSFTYLDSNAKSSFIQRIPNEKNFSYNETNYQLTDNRNTINNQLNSLISEAFNQAKTKAKDKINSLKYVSSELKKTALSNIDSAKIYTYKTENAQENWVYFGNDKNLKTIVDEIEKQNNFHKELIDYLDSKTLNSKNNVLSQKQKEAFKNDILSKNFSDQSVVNNYKNLINNVNNVTKNLKDYASELDLNGDKYNYASSDKKRTFDAYKTATDSLLNNKSGTIDSSKISKLQENLTNAYNALDGDIFINKVKELNYLTENLQNLIIKQIKAADPSQRQAIYEKAKKLNDDFGKTDLTLINTYNSAKSSSDYTDGSKARKSDFDTALTNLNAKLNTSKNKLEQPTPVPTNYTNFIENYISQYDQLKSTIATTYNNLDGNEITAEKARLNAIDLTFNYPSKETILPSAISHSSITNNLPNNSKANVVTSNIVKTDSNGTVSLNYQLVSTDPKFSYLPEDEKIKSDSKSATINGFLTSNQKALNDKKASLIEAINQAKNANKITESQKQALINAVNKATSLDELNKQEAKDNQIFKLTSTYEHLNPKQNQELFEKIQNATSTQDAQTIFGKQENVNLNNSMKKLKNLVIEYTNKKANVDYTSATNQSQFDTILNSANELISSITNNGTTNPSLNALIGDINQSGSLNNSFALLDGIKNKAKNDINGLSYLTEKQKQQYKSEIYRISDLQASKTKQSEVDKILTKAKLNQYNATFDYTNKSKITPSEIVDNNITKTIAYDSSLGSSTITTDQIVIKEIVKNNADGTATVKYVIKDATDQSLTSDTKESVIRDFKTGNQVEKERLDAINAVAVKATTEQKQNQASKLTNAQELQWEIQNNQNAEIVDKTVVGYNDITGKLKVSYRLKSTTSPNVYSDVKYAEIQGFQTEKQRLDALLTQDNAILTITNKKVPTEAIYGNDFNINFKDSNVQKVSFKNSPNITSRSDRDGQITFDYTLKSDREDLITIPEETNQTSEVVSAQSSSFTASGLLTEKERLENLFKNVISLNYSEPNKTNSTINPSQLQTQYLSIADANNYKINPQYELLSLTGDNYRNGTRNVKVTLTSTKNGLTDISYTYDLASLLNKETLSENEQKIVNRYTLTGFENEQSRLNKLAATFDYTNKATTLPSEANKDQITSNITTQNPEATIKIKDITAYDEITGAITFSYTFASTKNGISNDVESEIKTATLNWFKTEKMRLDELLTANKAQLEAKINALATAAYKDNLASNIINNFVIEDKNNSLTDARINVVLKEADDVKGQIAYTYNLVSTKTLNNQQNLSTQNSENASGVLSGFKTNADVESERLNSDQSYSINYVNKATTLASSLKDDAITNWTWNKPNDADYEFIDQKVIAYDDVNGKIKVEFKLKSTKNNLGKEVISDKKVVELTGFLTEKQRLDNLIKAIETSSVITNNQDALTKKPSQLTDNDFTITKPEAWNNENLNIALVIDNQDRDDETGTIKVSYQLSTTRTDLVSGYDNVDQNLVSDNAPKVTFNNYLTTSQEEINRLDAINPTYTNLNNQLLPSQINTDNSNNAFSINLPNDAEAQVVNLAIESQNDKDGSLTISYELQSTKNNLNTLQSAKKTYTFNKANNNQYFTETQRLDLLEYSPTLSSQTKATKTASEIKARDIEFANVENATVLISDINIVSINEVTGEVQITYLATSQRANLTDVKSSVKNATLNTLTELQRLNNLVDASQKVFNFAGDKAQNLTIVDEVALEQLSGYLAQEIDNQKTNILSQNKAKLVIDSIESKNSETGEIVLNWHLESNKNNLNNQVVKTTNNQYTFTGFQTANEREQQELNALENTDFTFTYHRTKLASELKTNPSGISIQSNREDTTAESVKVIAYNDVTGELVLQYVAKSTKNGTNFTSEVKTITLNGFKTEQQRLDQLADNLSNTSLIFNNDNSNRVNYLPSNATSTTQNNYAYANSVNDQASLNTMTFSADDETGSLTSQITLRSDKSRNDLIWSEDNLKYNDYQYSSVTSKAKELILTGFRTQNEQNNLDQAAERKRLNDLSAIFDYTDKTNVLPSDSIKDAITSQIEQTDSQATVKTIQISTRDEINGQITGKYVFVSTKDGIYSNLESDEKEFTISGFKTESQRLNDLLNAIEAQASIQNVSANQYKNHLPQEVLNQLILSANNLTNAQIQIVNKNANSADAAIDYTYRLVSTRGLVNGQNLNDVGSTATKNGQLAGFKSLKEAEKERLDAIDVNNTDDQFSHTIDYVTKNSQLASSLTQARGQNWNWQVNPDSDHEFVDQQIVGYNDITGELKVSYKLQSKKSGFESVQSETKYAIISGFKTEKQRLDDLVNNNQNQPVTISQNSDTLKDGAKAKKPSDLETFDFTSNLTSAGQNQNIKVYLELDTKNADNEHGTILVGYQLESTRNLTGENGLVSENWENKPAEKPLIKSEKSTAQEFSGYVTNDDEEANRIEKLLPLIKLDYPDKANYLPSLNENQVLDQNVQVKFKDGRDLMDEQVELKPNSLTIVKRDDEQGLIQVQYILVSTTRNNIERVVNATAQEDAKQLTGFKTELQRLQTLNYDWQDQITNKNSVSPSDLQQANINAINNELDQATNIQITSRNDKTGVISGTYSIYSKRPNLNTIHVDNVTFTINGLQTEDQRLDRVIADQNIAKTITYNKNDQNTTKASSLVANKAEVIKNLNNSYFVTSVANNEVNKAQIVIDDISANDETGTLTVTYHLTSLKEGLTDQRSSATKTLEIGGFLTNLQDAKNKAKYYIDQLVAKSKLTADQAEELKTEIDNATNNNEIIQLKTKADKQVIINDALKNFANLNQAQKDKLIEEITNSSDINEAQKIKEKYSDLNDKMGDLANLVAEYKKKKAEDKYTQATKITKDAFDDVIAKTEELLDKTNSTDLGTNIDEFLGTKEDHSDGSINQKYEALDGEIQKVIKQVEASELLSDDQKTSFKEELDKVSPKDLSYTENNQTKTLDDIKADILEKEQEKQRYINAINTFENLNQQQKDDYINQIKAANSSELETINEEARLLDNEMAKLKEAAKDQEAIQADSKYLEADKAVKNAYETAVIEANKVINGRPKDATENDDFNYNANKEQVTKLIEKLNLAKLNIEKDASKKAIDNLPNLNQNEKNNAKDLIDQATSKTEVETIEAVEKIRNDKKQPYIEQIQAISNLTDAEKTNYINEIKNTNLNLSPDNVVENVADFEAIILKAQKESLIKELEKSVNNDETTRILNAKQLEYFKNEINNATNSKQAQLVFTSALEVADKMANLKEKVAKYIELINDLNNTKYQNADNQELIQNKLKVANELLNSTTENGLDRDNDNLANLVANNENNQSLDYAYDILNGKENALKEKVNNSGLLSNEEKTSLNEQIDNVDKLNNEDEQITEIAKTIANKEEAKQDAINQINNLEHLNQSQKDSLINEIKSSNAQEKDNIVNKAKELDKAMDELQKEVQNSDEIHQSTAYQNATDEEKNNYDNALENAKQVLNNQKPNDYASSNLNQNEVVELINKLREIAKTIANKEEAKQDAIDQINNLEHLNQNQKDSLINEIKSSNAEEKDNIVNKAKELDRAMEELQNEVQDSEQVHQSTAYQNAIDEEKNNYDNALENAKQVLNNQKPNDYASSNLNQNEVAELINKLREIKNKQNENITEVLDTKELIASLNDLVNLTKTDKWNKFTKEQKDAINAAISNSNNILDNLDKYTNDDLKEQTEINRLLLNTKVNSKIWWLLILTAGTIATMGLIFIIIALKRRKVEDED
ncbi:lipoprotein 17-related variable surface protein [Mycoplasmopsis gallinacea]|uniref:Extracellular matrix-binding protein ebh GA module domain-containing protein n=1 Tax=Mycoplasmopsis gallinacea TaxID=29556 RepID=A0A6H0V6C9_9BACT|nr:lipoprotein 17-related variable surface protein [Mycoplasmopsis gallinacea]QIW62533.1 hypothetical protein GOQ20_03885 [Mycoplasmopsis gallinacea]